MAIDASIYQNLRQLEAPSMLDAATKAASLSGLAMQNQKMAKEMAETEHLRKASAFGSALESISGLPPEQKAAGYTQMREGLIKQGVISPEQAPAEYDDGFYRQTLMRYRQTAPSIEQRLKESQIAKNYADASRERLEKDPSKMLPSQRLGKMGGEVKQKIGFITNGLEVLTRYEDAFRKGGRQAYINSSTPLIGSVVSSTPIDDARTGLEEAIGRLASGGAINSGEEARFRRMIPTAADNDDDAARKIVNLRKDMENKLTAYGFKAGELGDLGFDRTALGYDTENTNKENRGLIAKAPGGGVFKEAQADGKQPPKAPAVNPGAIVMVGGKHYTVGADGDTLVPVKPIKGQRP